MQKNDVLRVLKLDGDANLRIYSSSYKGSGTSIIRWAAVKDQCVSSTGSKPITNSLEGKGLEQACLDNDTGACFSYPFNFNCLSGWFMVVDLWCCRNIPRFGGLYGQYDLVEYASGAPIQFSYKELKGLTNGFNEKLGAGSFGSIYRGMLGNGTIVEQPSQRTAISKVLHMLEGVTKIKKPPAPKSMNGGSFSGNEEWLRKNGSFSRFFSRIGKNDSPGQMYSLSKTSPSENQ
ncbi:hypothetical protein JHK86_003451 [Glycine max]|nr:hypothetical protein JHK86_003451 [Glycine max]